MGGRQVKDELTEGSKEKETQNNQKNRKNPISVFVLVIPRV